MRRSIILHDLYSPYYVGSIFRTAEGADVEKIFLTGRTPVPVDKFGGKRQSITNEGLASRYFLPFAFYDDVHVCIKELKNNGAQIIAVTQHERAVDYKEFEPQGDVAYIFGSEISGLEESILEEVDAIIHIPVRGKKGALNVSVAVGIILFNT